MKLHILDMPEETRDLALWLEEWIAGHELAVLVGQLSAGREVPEGPDLDEILGSEQPAVLAEGLAALKRSQLRSLLTRPAMLVELQTLALLEGGEFWQRLFEKYADESATTRHWNLLKTELRTEPDTVPSAGAGPDATAARRRHTEIAVLSGIAAALAIAAGIFLFQHNEPAGAGWGWDKAGALAMDGPADEYMNHLASSANEWFKKRPESRDEISARIQQFVDGCDELIGAPHTPLSKVDRDWLIERCRAWRGALVSHNEALKAGADPLEIRDQADATIRRLIDAIVTRADSLS